MSWRRAGVRGFETHTRRSQRSAQPLSEERESERGEVPKGVLWWWAGPDSELEEPSAPAGVQLQDQSSSLSADSLSGTPNGSCATARAEREDGVVREQCRAGRRRFPSLLAVMCRCHLSARAMAQA